MRTPKHKQNHDITGELPQALGKKLKQIICV